MRAVAAGIAGLAAGFACLVVRAQEPAHPAQSGLDGPALARIGADAPLQGEAFPAFRRLVFAATGGGSWPGGGALAAIDLPGSRKAFTPEVPGAEISEGDELAEPQRAGEPPLKKMPRCDATRDAAGRSSRASAYSASPPSGREPTVLRSPTSTATA